MTANENRPPDHDRLRIDAARSAAGRSDPVGDTVNRIRQAPGSYGFVALLVMALDAWLLDGRLGIFLANIPHVL